MKMNPMVSKRCCQKVTALMSILLSSGYGSQAIAAEPYTEPANPWEVLSCNPVGACFLSVLMEVIPQRTAEDKPVGVGPNQTGHEAS